MKITINNKVLKSALESANKVINPKASLPITTNFLLRAEGDYLAVIATDTGITIKESVPCLAEGEAVLPVNLLELVRVLPDGDVTIEADSTLAKVAWSNGNSTIPAFDPKDYPDINTNPSSDYIKIDGSSLSSALSHTIPHLDNNELHPQMSGVYFNAKSGSAIELVATDTHTLGLYTIQQGNGSEFDFICPFNSVKLLAGVAKSQDVEFVTDETNIFFRIGATTIVTRKIIGRYPNYASIIPKSFNSQLTAKKSELVSAIKRVLVCANKASGHIKLSLGLLGCFIESEDISTGTAAKESLDGVTYDGADLVIGFKGDYLLRCISAIEGNEVTIKFTEAKKAAIVTGDEDTSIALIMPVALT